MNIYAKLIKKMTRCLLLIVLILASMQNSFAETINNNNYSLVTTKQVSSNDAIANTLILAISLIGIPYRWGGNSPQTGMDCSGFIHYIFQKSMGIVLPRTASEMFKVGKPINLNNLEPGDLLFFHTEYKSRRISHMGMYVGNNKFIQSPHTGSAIEISDLNGYWRSRTSGAKRIVQENIDDNGHIILENYQNIKKTKARHINYPSNSKHEHHVIKKNQEVDHVKINYP